MSEEINNADGGVLNVPEGDVDENGCPLLDVPYDGIKFDMYVEFHDKFPELPAAVFEWHYWHAPDLTDGDLSTLRDYLVANDILKDHPELSRSVCDLHFPEDPDTEKCRAEALAASKRGDVSWLDIFNEDFNLACFLESSLDNLMFIAKSMSCK